MSTLIIEDFYFRVAKEPLKKPYKLSFGTINYFDIINLYVKISGNTFRGEVVPLPGYKSENIESIIGFYKNQKRNILGQKILVAREKIKNESIENQFAKSAVLSAIDLALNKDFFSSNYSHSQIDFVTPISLETKIQKHQLNKTIKIKLTGDPNFDCESLDAFYLMNKNLQNQTRLDANQAYSLKQAEQVLSYISNAIWRENVAYLEQPLISTNWLGTQELVNSFPAVPLTLDESVITENDIRKCKEINIPFVKFKLYKQGGIQELESHIKLANKLGLKIVLGNGVATTLTNKIENHLYKKYKHMIFGASEANGFLKIQQN